MAIFADSVISTLLTVPQSLRSPSFLKPWGGMIISEVLVGGVTFSQWCVVMYLQQFKIILWVFGLLIINNVIADLI